MPSLAISCCKEGILFLGCPCMRLPSNVSSYPKRLLAQILTSACGSFSTEAQTKMNRLDFGVTSRKVKIMVRPNITKKAQNFVGYGHSHSQDFCCRCTLLLAEMLTTFF